MRKYEVSMEVEGPLAHFGRRDTGDSFGTYPMPTWSAAKGMFEAVCRIRSSKVVPTKVAICRPICTMVLGENYRGCNRKHSHFKHGNAMQVRREVLTDVCYKLWADVIPTGERFTGVSGKIINGPHFYQDRFNKRLGQGISFSPIFLGLKPFVATYFGPQRDDTEIDTTVNIHIPLMPRKFESGSLVNLHVVGGVLSYVE